MSKRKHWLPLSIARMRLPCFVIALIWMTHAMSQDTLTSSQHQQVATTLQIMNMHLKQGEPMRAREALESTAASVHADEIELGIIQTLMHQGEYRHALSAAAHTQAEHPDVIDTSLYYAWLLCLGGNDQIAMDLLNTMQVATQENIADQQALKAMQSFIRAGKSNTHLLPPLSAVQYHPLANQLNPQLYTPIGGGALIDQQYAIAPQHGLALHQPLVVRNALGNVAQATVIGILAEGNAVLLHLESGLPTPINGRIQRNASPLGKLVTVIGYPAINDPQLMSEWEPVWPRLATDVLSMPPKMGKQSGWTLHTNLSAGAPVFNNLGEIIGILINDQLGHRSLLSFTSLDLPTESNHDVASQNKPTPSEIYEWGMLSALEVFKVNATTPTDK